MAALRLAALLAVAVTLAGLTSRDAAPRPVAGKGLPGDSVGSQQVIDGSLKAKDLRPGVALSPAKAADLYLKMSAATELYLSKLDAAQDYLQKAEAATLYLKMGDAASTYLKLQEAEETYLKLDAAADFLDLTEALNIFIKHEDAEETFLSKIQAASDYLQKIDAAAIYIKHDVADATYLKLEDAAKSYLKLEDAADFLSKIDAANIYLDKEFAANTYLDKEAAAETYIKQGTEIDAYKLGGIPADGFVQGDGSVHTGLVVLGLDGEEKLLDVPGMVSVVAVAQGKEGGQAKLVSTSPEPLLVSYGGTSIVLEPEGTHGILIGLNQPTLVQLIGIDKGGLGTLTLTASQLGQEQLAFSGQALSGTP